MRLRLWAWFSGLALLIGCGYERPASPQPVTLEKETSRKITPAAIPIGTQAPEIEGEDIDGVPFRLSDYRGNVVLLDFWGNW